MKRLSQQGRVQEVELLTPPTLVETVAKEHRYVIEGLIACGLKNYNCTECQRPFLSRKPREDGRCPRCGGDIK